MNNSGKGKDEEEGRAGKEGRESKETGECSRGKEVERERESGQTALDKNNSTSGFEFERTLSEPCTRCQLPQATPQPTAGGTHKWQQRRQNRETIISKRSGWARIISRKEEEPQSIANGCETDNEP